MSDERNLQSYSETPTRLEMAVALFSKRATSEAIGSVHTRTVRIPTIEDVSIQALALHSGLSINKVIVQLLEVALDEVWAGMSDEDHKELIRIRGQLLTKMIAPDGTLPVQEFEQAVAGEI